MNLSEWRHEWGDEIIAEARYDALHCGGQQGWLEREKYSLWMNASTKMVMAAGLQDITDITLYAFLLNYEV